MRDYSAAVADTLLPLVNAAIAEGPSAVLALSQALRAYERKVYETRDTMLVFPVFHCCDCGKHWTASMTVAREREAQPSNCPACFNQTHEHPSCWTTFRYVDAPKD